MANIPCPNTSQEVQGKHSQAKGEGKQQGERTFIVGGARKQKDSSNERKWSKGELRPDVTSSVLTAEPRTPPHGLSREAL